MYPPITYELLKSKKACGEQLELVKEYFGLDPIPLTDEVIEKFGSMFDIHWVTLHLLTLVDLIEHRKVKVYALSEYNRVNDLAWIEYLRSKDLAGVEYHKVRELALSEYRKVVTKDFVRLYTRGLVVTKDFVRLYTRGLVDELSS